MAIRLLGFSNGFLTVAIALLLSTHAALACAWLERPADLVAEVTDVIDGDTIALADGREVRLVGIQAPKLPLGRRGFETWPGAEEARQALLKLTPIGSSVSLVLGQAGRDRHRRLLAHVLTDDGWVQAAMLRQGQARTYSFADNRMCVTDLLAAESKARDDEVGIWARDYYRVKSATDRLPRDRFELVEGVVTSTARVGDRIFVNFGDDYRTDFTVLVERADWGRFRQAGMDLVALEGARVRVRGWIERWNGPLMRLDHPERLERLPW